MPTYNYRCEKCYAELEIFQSFDDEPLTVCSLCFSPLYKVLYPPTVFVDGGIYNLAKQAEFNTKYGYGKYGVSEREELNKKEEPVDLSLAKMSKRAQDYYVETGKKRDI